MNKNIKQSIIFIALVIGLSYFVFWGPIALLKLRTANLVEGKIHNITALILFLIGGFIPSILGIVMTSIFDGKNALRKLFVSAINIKIGLPTFLIIIGYVFLLGIMQLVLYSFFGGRFDYSQFIKQLPTIIPLLFFGPLSEEFGWRGFLQKKLNQEFSPIAISLIIGIIWSLWHLPLFYMIGTSQHEFNIPFISFMISIISSTFIYTYVYNKSDENLLSVILLHWLGTFILQVIASQVSRTTTYNFLECIPALLIACVFMILLLTQKRKTKVSSN